MKMKCRIVLVALIVAPLGVPGLWAQETHPRLVSVASTRCVSCHEEDVLRGRDVIHEPASEDCTTCHDVAITESETRITITEQEPALCLSCHDELERAASGELEASHHPVMDSCLSCHDPHASAVRQLLVSPLKELCADCHDVSDLLVSHRNQVTEKANCLRCHLPHGSSNARMLTGSRLHPPFADGDCGSCHRPLFAGRVRLRARGERLCTACHDEIVEPVEEGGSFHAALKGRRGRAGCISCHDPHMSSNEALLEKVGLELCGKCHESVVEASTAESGHEAAADDCLNCHAPHRAEKQNLLAEPVPDLCLFCHDAEDPPLVQAHLQADIGALQCTSCHTPHGAGNPKLLARYFHEALADGCDTCHEGTANEVLEDGESELCLMCHDDIGELVEKAAVPHPALEVGRCIDCHNPHASSQEHLVKAPAGGECLECHDEQGAARGELAHGVIDLLGCRACHEPHGGENAKLLRESGSALCLACHDSKNLRVDRGARSVLLLNRFDVAAESARLIPVLRLSADGVRNHPVTGHRVVGAPTEEELRRIETTFEGELSCLACHDPHKSRSDKLLVGGAASTMEACLQCHPK
ncbi:MAG: cytochrome c3 family protein [Acidobacteriota bacterium]